MLTLGGHHRSAWQALAVRGSPRVPAILVTGALCVVLAGVVWALFAHELQHDGHAPSRVLPPFDTASYYQAQSWFITPVLLGLWLLLSFISYRITGGSRVGSLPPLAGWLGIVYGLSVLGAFVGPEWLVYRTDGIHGLRSAVRYTAPALACVTWFGATLVLLFVRRVPLSRAAMAAFVALLVQAMAGAPFLR